MSFCKVVNFGGKQTLWICIGGGITPPSADEIVTVVSKHATCSTLLELTPISMPKKEEEVQEVPVCTTKMLKKKFEKTLWVLHYETLKKKYPECFGKKRKMVWWFYSRSKEEREREQVLRKMVVIQQFAICLIGVLWSFWWIWNI